MVQAQVGPGVVPAGFGTVRTGASGLLGGGIRVAVREGEDSLPAWGFVSHAALSCRKLET